MVIGMGNGGHYQLRAPGPVGVAATTKPQNVSWYNRGIQWADWKGEVPVAKVYFGTDEWQLTPDDRKALIDLARSLREFLLHDRGIAKVRCEGRADIRGEATYNQDLSGKRARTVTSALNALLAPVPGCQLQPERGLGKTLSSPLTAAYAEDRRVDVFTRVTTRSEIEAKKNPFARIRAEIFRKFFFRPAVPPQSYDLWKGGLEYLIDQYELNDQKDISVSIKPSDEERVHQLIVKLAKQPDQATVRAFKTREEIRSGYEIEYRRAYDDAYPRYEAEFWSYWKSHPALSAEQVRQAVLGL